MEPVAGVENAFAAVRSSVGPRKYPIDLEHGVPSSSSHQRTNAADELPEKPARDPRNALAMPTPPMTSSRTSSPFTQTPTVDFDGLSWPSIGAKARLHQTPQQEEERMQKLTGAVRTMLECIGEDPDREGLYDTPERYAKTMMFFTKGYEENLRDILNGAVFSSDHDEMVLVQNIDIFSLCEHHLVPIIGKMHIGYIPDQQIIGLSKLPRIATMFARRLQLQERLTRQVALAISEVIKPRGVAVVMESSHMCMAMRGVQQTNAKTITSCMLGCFRSAAKTREEFLRLIDHG